MQKQLIKTSYWSQDIMVSMRAQFSRILTNFPLSYTLEKLKSKEWRMNSQLRLKTYPLDNLLLELKKQLSISSLVTIWFRVAQMKILDKLWLVSFANSNSLKQRLIEIII